MTDDTTVKSEEAPKPQLTDDEILSRAKQINNQREMERIKEEKRLEEERLAKEAEEARLKQIEEEKRSEEMARARALVDEENRKRENEARLKEAEKQAEIMRAEEAKKAADAKKAAELAAAKKLVAEDKKKNPPEKKKHTGLKVALIIIAVFLVAILLAIFSFGVSITNLTSSGSIHDNQTTHQIWLPIDKTVSIGNYNIVANKKHEDIISLTYGNQNEILYQSKPSNNVKDLHVKISLLWGLLTLQEFDMSINDMTFHSINSENDAYCTATIYKTKPVTGQNILLWALGVKGIKVL